MSTAKFEKLIDLIINEDNEKAEQLFHEIVVETSRDIYETLINEDMTSGLIDEITSEEEGMDGVMEDDAEFIDDEEIDGDYDVDGEEGDIEVDDEVELDGEDEDEEDLEDRVVDLEDKLDELMAEFEAMMDGEEEEEEGEEEEEEGEEEEEESGIMENVEMKKVSVTHVDGSDKSAEKSPNDNNSGQTGMASKPVNFSGGSAETGRTAPTTKPVNNIKYKNAPDGGKNVGDGKGESAPKPVTKQPAGDNERSPVPESKKSTKRRI